MGDSSYGCVQDATGSLMCRQRLTAQSLALSQRTCSYDALWVEHLHCVLVRAAGNARKGSRCLWLQAATQCVHTPDLQSALWWHAAAHVLS